MRATALGLLLVLGFVTPLLAGALSPTAVAVRPDLTIWKTVDLAVADPGDVLTYTIYLDNRGGALEPARWVWVNDTLPSGVVHRSDTANLVPGYVNTSLVGNTVRWQLRNVPSGNHSFQMTASLTSLPGYYSDAQVLRNVAALWYTNATGVPQPTLSASATTTISIPVVSVTKSGVFTAADAITYSVTVTNAGTGTAGTLWWNDTLPAGVLFSRVRPPLQGAACTGSGRWVNCTLTSFAPSSRTWSLEATIPAPLPPGSTIVNWVYVNYTDVDGTKLVEVRASAPLTVATAAITVAKVPSTVVIPPGGTLVYTIFYTNTGQVAAPAVWINDTLPLDAGLPAVTVLSAVPSPVLTTTTVVRWLFAGVSPGNHSLALTVRAGASLGNGTRITNCASLNYSNANGRDRPGSVGCATTTVSLIVPAILADFVGSPARVRPGGTIAYVLYYNNSRPALAKSVVAEVFLPAGLPLTFANPVYNLTGPGKYVWDLPNVGAGEHRIDLTVSVPSDLAAGVVLRATAFVNYTDDRGSRVGGSQASALVTVVPVPPADSPPWLLAGIGAAVGAVLAAILVLRYRMAGNQTVIDEVFLLHRDGLLVKHYTRRLKPDVDSDILSGMLIAVQNFVNESFIGEAGLKKEGQLDEMKFGEYRILLVRGAHVIVAAVVSGPRVEKVPAQIRAAIDDLESSLGTVLDAWDGDMDEVAGADRFMQDLIAGRYRGRTSRPRGNR